MDGTTKMEGDGRTTMGVRADIREEVRKEMDTKIHGPTDNRQIKKDVTILEK